MVADSNGQEWREQRTTGSQPLRQVDRWVKGQANKHTVGDRVGDRVEGVGHGEDGFSSEERCVGVSQNVTVSMTEHVLYLSGCGWIQ